MSKAMHLENFPLQGETFRSTDKRSKERVIRLESFATRLGYEWPFHYRYVVVTDEDNPNRVGKRGNISQKTIENHYWKISH